MGERIFKFFVFSLTILTVNLVSGAITDYFLEYKGTTNPFKFTMIGMIAVVLIFYPLFGFLDNQIQRLASRVLKKGKGIFGRTIGIIAAYLLCLFILFCFYAHMWFRLEVIKSFINTIF